MRNAGRSTCRVCGRHKREVGAISHAGYCIEHGKEIYLANMDGLHYHDGPWFQHWRRCSLAALGVVLDEPPSSP
jgi:hypothetical protein